MAVGGPRARVGADGLVADYRVSGLRRAPSKTPPRPAAVTLAARDAKVKPPPRPRGRARSRAPGHDAADVAGVGVSASNPDLAATGRSGSRPAAAAIRSPSGSAPRSKSAKVEVRFRRTRAPGRNAIKMGKVGVRQLAQPNFSAAGFKPT